MGEWKRQETFQNFLLKAFYVSVIFKMLEIFSLDIVFYFKAIFYKFVQNGQ